MGSKTSTKKEPKKSKAQEKASTAQEPQPENNVPKPEDESTPEPELMSTRDMQTIIEALAKTVSEHTGQITELQAELARKRKPTQSDRVQIRDRQTGKTYPSKNNCYRTLLKSGELKDLVDAGMFGPAPEKNTFGWYALVRALPDRFEEVKTEQEQTNGKLE